MTDAAWMELSSMNETLNLPNRWYKLFDRKQSKLFKWADVFQRMDDQSIWTGWCFWWTDGQAIWWMLLLNGWPKPFKRMQIFLNSWQTGCKWKAVWKQKGSGVHFAVRGLIFLSTSFSNKCIFHVRSVFFSSSIVSFILILLNFYVDRDAPCGPTWGETYVDAWWLEQFDVGRVSSLHIMNILNSNLSGKL